MCLCEGFLRYKDAAVSIVTDAFVPIIRRMKPVTLMYEWESIDYLIYFQTSQLINVTTFAPLSVGTLFDQKLSPLP